MFLLSLAQSLDCKLTCQLALGVVLEPAVTDVLCPVKAMIHVSTMVINYDYEMYDSLLRETTDHDVSVERLIV